MNQPTVTPGIYRVRMPPAGKNSDYEIDLSKFSVSYRFIENQPLPSVISSDPFTGYVAATHCIPQYAQNADYSSASNGYMVNARGYLRNSQLGVIGSDTKHDTFCSDWELAKMN